MDLRRPTRGILADEMFDNNHLVASSYDRIYRTLFFCAYLTDRKREREGKREKEHPFPSVPERASALIPVPLNPNENYSAVRAVGTPIRYSRIVA